LTVNCRGRGEKPYNPDGKPTFYNNYVQINVKSGARRLSRIGVKKR